MAGFGERLREFIETIAGEDPEHPWTDTPMWDGYDVALIGIYDIDLGPVRAVYSMRLLREASLAQGIPATDVDEWLQYNVLGTPGGDRVPIVVSDDFLFASDDGVELPAEEVDVTP
jgi:hypothetical protein